MDWVDKSFKFLQFLGKR